MCVDVERSMSSLNIGYKQVLHTVFPYFLRIFEFPSSFRRSISGYHDDPLTILFLTCASRSSLLLVTHLFIS
jgi:hypothetical protein